MRIYIVFVGVAVVVGAYLYGRQVSDARCQIAHAQNITQQQIEIIQTKGKVNEAVNHTAVADIRNILRQKYTIAE